MPSFDVISKINYQEFKDKEKILIIILEFTKFLMKKFFLENTIKFEKVKRLIGDVKKTKT